MPFSSPGSTQKGLFILCAALLVVSSVLTGCKKKRGGMDVPFWHAMGGEVGTALEEMVADFNATHPGLPVVPVGMGSYGSLSQKLMAAVAAGDPPVLAQVYESWSAQFMESGAIVPFDTYIHGAGGLGDEELGDIFPVLVEGNTWDGKVVTFPFNKSVPAFFYNRDMFREVGLDPDRFPETWDEFVDAAKRLTRDTNRDGVPEQWGFAMPVNVWIFGCILLGNGGRLLTPEGAAAFDEPPGVDALERLRRLLKEDGVAYLTTGYQHQDDFLAGKVGMIQSSIASYAFMKSKLTFDLGVAPFPRTRERAVLVYGTNVTLFEESTPDQRAKAWEFVRWFTAPESQARWSRATTYVPVRRTALDLPEMKEWFEEIPGLRATMLQMEDGRLEPRIREWFTGRRLLEDEALEPVLRGAVGPAEGLRQAAEEFDAELAATRG
jgi:multiple sugar transport system substrate-binding protein